MTRVTINNHTFVGVVKVGHAGKKVTGNKAPWPGSNCVEFSSGRIDLLNFIFLYLSSFFVQKKLLLTILMFVSLWLPNKIGEYKHVLRRVGMASVHARTPDRSVWIRALPGSFYSVIRKETELSQCLSPLGSINDYRQQMLVLSCGAGRASHRRIVTILL